jgi:rubrerythrin
MYGNKEYESNRDKARKPKKDKFWCKSCDMSTVGEGSKCPVCGNRENRKRNKK